MEDNKFIMFKNRLVKVFRHLNKQAKRSKITCYRLYDHDLPEFPFCIEFYEDKLYVAEYKRRHGMSEDEHEQWIQKCMESVVEALPVKSDAIFLKLRRRKPGRLGQYQKLDKQLNEFVVNENGLQFIVNLSDYLDTGLFLDHRITRQMVKDESRGKKVLNLFAYTGSFSVYAAAGEAAEVVTVDLSKTYLKWAERNMELNGFVGKAGYRYVHADVKQYLPTLASGYFDIVVMDPPTFSNSQRMKDFLEIQQDHVGLINECIGSMKPDARLYFSTNYKNFRLDEKGIKASAVEDITKATTPFDFAGRLFRSCFLIIK